MHNRAQLLADLYSLQNAHNKISYAACRICLDASTQLPRIPTPGSWVNIRSQRGQMLQQLTSKMSTTPSGEVRTSRHASARSRILQQATTCQHPHRTGPGDVHTREARGAACSLHFKALERSSSHASQLFKPSFTTTSGLNLWISGAAAAQTMLEHQRRQSTCRSTW